MRDQIDTSPHDPYFAELINSNRILRAGKISVVESSTIICVGRPSYRHSGFDGGDKFQPFQYF